MRAKTVKQKKMKSLVILVIIQLVIGLQGLQACNCPKNGNGTRAQSEGWLALANLANYDSQLIKDYCRADFCLEASVKSDKSFIEDDSGRQLHAFYSFKSVRYFRYKPSSLEAIESGLFLTPMDSCGVEIKGKGIYYLCGTALGPNAWVSSCDLNKKFENLSFSERIFFLAGYKKVNCLDRLEEITTEGTTRQPPQKPREPSRKPQEIQNHSQQAMYPMFTNFSQNSRPEVYSTRVPFNEDEFERTPKRPNSRRPPRMSPTPTPPQFEFEYEFEEELTTKRPKKRPNYESGEEYRPPQRRPPYMRPKAEVVVNVASNEAKDDNLEQNSN